MLVVSQDETQKQVLETDPQFRTDSEIQEPKTQSHTDTTTSTTIESHPLSVDQGAEVQTVSDSGTKHGNQKTGTEHGHSECEEHNEITDDEVKSKTLVVNEEAGITDVGSDSHWLLEAALPERDIVKGDVVSDRETSGEHITEGSQDTVADGHTVQPVVDQSTENLVDLKITTPCDVIANVPKIELEHETVTDQVTVQSTNRIEDSAIEVEPSAPAMIDLSENVQLVCTTNHDVRTEERMLYPRLDSIIQGNICY